MSSKSDTVMQSVGAADTVIQSSGAKMTLKQICLEVFLERTEVL